MRVLFGPGLRGEIAERIQRALQERGFEPGRVDGWYGDNTSKALRRFQAGEALPETGTVDATTWTRLIGAAPPLAGERSLGLTALLEGHGYEKALGDWDGAGLTWGVIGFTLKHGEVQKILLEVAELWPALLRGAFDDLTEELLEVLGAELEDQMDWARSITVGAGVSHGWRLGFESLGRRPEVRAIQLRRAHDDYLVPAIATARRLGMRSELGLALCFDIHVQNGGLRPSARRAIAEAPAPATERDLRLLVADTVADGARAKYRDDVRARKRAIAAGSGTVHGLKLVLERWGLTEEGAQELT